MTMTMSSSMRKKKSPPLDPTPNLGARPTCSPTSGSPAAQLLAMCAEEGMLPADVITAVCERLGCAEEIEVYR